MQPQPDGKKKKKKTKGNGLPPNGQGKKKNRGSKKLPLQLFATFPSGTLTDDGEVMKIDATIIYHKTATMALEIAFKDVKLRNEVLNSYDVHMFEPGYGVSLSEGTLCDLMGSTFKIQNPCPYVLYVRMQRPMGFRDDPSALGMWEPIGGVLIHEIKPGQILTLGSPNSSTDHMVPREDTVAGKRTVHLFSFTVFRDAMSISAANPNQASIDKEIALVLEVITRFKSSNGDVGEQDLYTVESFSGSERLNHVVKGPLVPLRLCDVSSPEGPITFASLNRDHDLKGFKPYCLSFFSGKKAATATTLDKKTIYRTSFIETLIDPISNKNFNASYICNMAFPDGTHNWVLGTIQSDGNFLPGNTNEKWSTGVITGGDWLYPLSPNAKAVFSTRRGEAIKGLQSFRHATSYREIKTSELMIGQTLLTALVIIYHVSKVAMEVLEIAGVIKNEDVRLRSAVRKLSLS